MSSTYGREPAHLLILGTEAHRLRFVADTLTNAGARVTTGTTGTMLRSIPLVTTLVVAEQFDTDMERRQWDDIQCVIREAIEQALGRMATLSTALIVAYTTRDDPCARGEIRASLSDLCERLASTDSMLAGIDLTVNALETPIDRHDQTVTDALIRHLHRRSFLTSGAVVPVEHLAHSSINEAITNDFI